jgi:hypothetical protein
MQLHGGFRILRVHVDDEVGIFGEERHLAFRIAPVGAMCVRFNKLPDRESICSFTGRDGSVFAHERASFLDYLSDLPS